MSLFLGSCIPQKDIPQNLTQINYFRIVVPTAGYYYIALRDLISLGLSTPDLNNLYLYYSGQPYPFWLVKVDKVEDSKIYFYAPSSEKSSNIKDTIFILAFEGESTSSILTPNHATKVNGQKISLSEGTIIKHLEENYLYLPDSKSDDRWYWSLISTEDEGEVKFSLAEVGNSDLKIRAHFWSPTSATIDPDHAIRLVVNQSKMQDIYWDGKGEHTAETLVFLSENKSDISLEISTNQLADQIPQKIYLDWIEVEYQQPLMFSDETLHFKMNEKLVMQTDQMDGFLLSSTKENIPQEIYRLPEETITAIPNQTETYFSWVPEANFKAVNSIQAIEKPQINLAPVEYLVIAPKAFHQTLQPLMDFREQQGYETALLSTQEIYDYFSSGSPSPLAIQSFLQQMNAKNAEHPKYLLLVGDYTYEFLDYESSIQMLPSFFIDTSLAGETVSDFPFSDVDGDNKPDLAIGRIPTSDMKQLAIWVEKQVNYEKQATKNLQNIISISDSSVPTFNESAKSFLKPFDRFSALSHVHIAGDEGFLDHYQPAFSAPNSLVVYFGHGSIDRWGHQPILTSQQLLEVEPPFNPAFIFSFSCLNGYFIHPEKQSLTETLLFHPNIGTIAVLASTSLTLNENQVQFSDQIISELQLERNVNIGDLFTSAMREINSENQLNLDVINSFILFGDPATSFPLLHAPQGN